MARIIGLAGKKQSGKSTICNFLHGYQLKSQEIIDGFEVTTEGELVIDTLVLDANGKEQKGKGIVDITRTDFDFASWAVHNMWPHIKHYAFADPLKDIATSLFDIPREKLYGSDADKNTLTKYLWEEMPVPVKGKKGPMTVREFIQYFGTEVCRFIKNDVWVDRTMTDIANEEPTIAVIADVRFLNEVEAIQKAGGKVVKLTRSVDNDSHASECELDNFTGFDAILDNANLNIEESCHKVLGILDEWGWLSKEVLKPKKNRQFTTTVK